MGRKSALTPKQWEQIGKRLVAGESTSSLAREFGVGKSTISERFSERTNLVRAAALLVAKAGDALDPLTVPERFSAHSLADDLRAISTHLAGAGKFGAATAHRLSGIAHAKVQEIDDAAPLDDASMEALKGVAVLTKLANDSSQIGLNLLAANKDMLAESLRPKAKEISAFEVIEYEPDA